MSNDRDDRGSIVALVHKATNFQQPPDKRAKAALEAARKLQRLAESLQDEGGKRRRCRACGTVATCANCGGVNP